MVEPLGTVNDPIIVSETAAGDSANGPVTPGTVAANSKLVGGQFNTSLPTLTNTQQAAIQIDSSGRQIVTGPVTETPGTSGGLSVYRNISLVATGISVKGTPGQVYGWYFFNSSAAARFIKLYNKASAPTVGTDTPVMTIPLGAGSGANVSIVGGIAFSLGIGIAATNLVADADTTAPTANDVVANLLYK